jgi:hypothetical protein
VAVINCGDSAVEARRSAHAATADRHPGHHPHGAASTAIDRGCESSRAVDANTPVPPALTDRALAGPAAPRSGPRHEWELSLCGHALNILGR